MKHNSVIIYYDEIVNSVKDVALSLSRTLADVSDEIRVQISDIAEEDNIARLKRLIDLSVENMRQALSSYCSDLIPCTNAVDNIENSSEKVVFRMNIPDSFGRTSANLSSFCHEYIVNKVMAEHLKVTYLPLMQTFAEAAEEHRTCMKRALNRRNGGLRIKASPF